ncbi:MAG: hypothetical protein GXP62_04965 [Oligoflexia bacterium]|nr:hypothetical protein [Oligoflexia bacterium]
MLTVAIAVLFACKSDPPPAPINAPGIRDPSRGVADDAPPAPGQRDVHALTLDGPTVTLSGTVTYWQANTDLQEVPIEYSGSLRLEVLREPDADGYSAMLHSQQLDGPGPFTLAVPQDLGQVHLFAYVDAGSNGPDPDEPRGNTKDFKVAQEDIGGLDLVIGPAQRRLHHNY